MAMRFDPVQQFDKAPDAMVLRPKQCCDVLNCSIPTYYRWAKQGRLALVKVGPGVSGSTAGSLRRLLAGA
jgi:excisionase family DNA binding protein